jgi:hypothetical protein
VLCLSCTQGAIYEALLGSPPRGSQSYAAMYGAVMTCTQQCSHHLCVVWVYVFAVHCLYIYTLICPHTRAHKHTVWHTHLFLVLASRCWLSICHQYICQQPVTAGLCLAGDDVCSTSCLCMQRTLCQHSTGYRQLEPVQKSE